MAKRYPLNIIKTRRSYSVEEVAELFAVNKKTCFRWKEEGLQPIVPGAKPLLFMGYEVKRFLKKRQSVSKVMLKVNEYYCLRCRRAVRAKAGSEKTVSTGKRIGKDNRVQHCKKAICEKCGLKISRFK